MIIEVLVGAVLSYTLWSLVTLQINYRRASSMGVPLIRQPVDPLNIPFTVLEPHLFGLLDLFPIQLPSFLYYLRRGWHFGDKADTHLEHGPIWALVTPRDIHLHVSDSEAIHSIFSRRGEFIRPSKMYSEFRTRDPEEDSRNTLQSS